MLKCLFTAATICSKVISLQSWMKPLGSLLLFAFHHLASGATPFVNTPVHVEAVLGFDKNVTLPCKFGGFENSKHWSIKWYANSSIFPIASLVEGSKYDSTNKPKVKSSSHSEYLYRTSIKGRHKPRMELTANFTTPVRSGSGDCSIVLSNLKADSAETYTVIVDYNKRVESTVYLHISDPSRPQQAILIPSNKNPSEGRDSLELICNITGAKPKVKSVVWYKDNRIINEKEGFSRIRFINNMEAQVWKLTISSVRREDRGIYMCRGGNNPSKNWTVMDSTEVIVHSVPSAILEIIPNAYARLGERRTIKCRDKAKAYPEARLILSKLSQRIPLVRSERGPAIEDIKERISEADEGQYSCTASNKHGNSTSFARLIIQKLEVRLNTISSISVSEGDRVSIYCSTNRNANISWYGPDNRLVSSDSATDQLHLLIGSAHTSDGGLYTCTAKMNFYDGKLTANSTSVKITVKNTPKVTKVEQQLPDGKALEGEMLKLACHYTKSIPPGKAFWQFNQTKQIRNVHVSRYENEEVLTLIYNEITRHHTGKYTCQVSNGEGKPSRRDIFVEVTFRASLRFQIHPFNRTRVGENRALQCRDNAMATPIPTMKLLKNGRTLHTVHNHSISHWIYNVQLSDAGQYTCDAFNQYSDKTHAYLVVEYGPKVRLFQKEIIIHEHDRINVTCQVDSEPFAHIQIFGRQNRVYAQNRVGDNIVTWDDRVLRNHAGIVTCEGTVTFYDNFTKNVSANTSIVVQYPPSNLKVTSIGNSTVGSFLYITCNYDDGNPEAIVKWTYRKTGHKNVTQLQDELIRSQPVGRKKFSSIVSIHNLNKNDNGEYNCTVFSKEFPKRVTKSYALFVKFPPSKPYIHNHTHFINKVGSLLNVSCIVNESLPEPKILWRLDGKPLNDITETRYRQQAEYGEGLSSNFGIIMDESLNKKTLSCLAFNSVFPNYVVSDKMLIIVEFPPVIVNHINGYPLLSERVDITCVAAGNPVPSIEWKIGSIPIRANRDESKYSITEYVFSNNITSTITYYSVTANEISDQYQCIAKNDGGTDSMNVKIQEAVIPKKPSLHHVDRITQTAVRLRWIYKDDERNQPIWFQAGYTLTHRSKFEGNQLISSFLQEKIRSKNVTIVDLRPNKLYTFRVRACSRVGCSDTDKKLMALPIGSQMGYSIEDQIAGDNWTVLDFTLLIVIICLTIALLYLVVVLGLCARKIKILEETAIRQVAEKNIQLYEANACHREAYIRESVA